MNDPLFTASDHGDGEPLPYANDTEFVDSLTPAQQVYFHSRLQDRQADLQQIMCHLATGLSIVNEMHDAAVRGVAHLETCQRSH